MTREEIKNQLERDFHDDYSLRGDVVSMYEDAIFYVDKIFTDFKSRTCNNCKYDSNQIECNAGIGRGECRDSLFSCSEWNAKDE